MASLLDHGDQLLHFFGWRRALNLEDIGQFTTGGRGIAEQELSARIISHANVHLGVFDDHVQVRRVPRQLAEHSKADRGNKVVER